MYVNEYLGPHDDHLPTKDLTVNNSGYALLNEYDTGTYRPNGLPDYQILYIEKGICYFNTGSEVIKIGGKKAVFFQPGDPQIYNYRKSDGSKIYWIHFTGERVEELLQSLNLNNKKIIKVNNDEAIKNAVYYFTSELKMKKPGYKIAMAGQLLSMLVNLSRDEKSKVIKQSQTINEICKKIQENYNSKETNADYAIQCNMSVSYFLSLFKKNTGTTPQQYKLRCKINVAEQMLITTNFNIKVISEHVGFDDPLYFTRYFKKATGYSPKEYRKKFMH